MATTLKFLPGSTIRWRATRIIVVEIFPSPDDIVYDSLLYHSLREPIKK